MQLYLTPEGKKYKLSHVHIHFQQRSKVSFNIVVPLITYTKKESNVIITFCHMI